MNLIGVALPIYTTFNTDNSLHYSPHAMHNSKCIKGATPTHIMIIMHNIMMKIVKNVHTTKLKAALSFNTRKTKKGGGGAIKTAIAQAVVHADQQWFGLVLAV